MLGDTRSRVAVLEQRTEDQQRFFEKVDTAIQVMQEAVASVTQMLAVHNERLEQHSKTETLLVEMIKEVKTSLEAENVDLADQIHEIDQRVDELKKFKWTVVGIASATGFVCSVLVSLASGWLTPSEINYRMEAPPSVEQRR
jgi:ElaB/YqjD/DUF883 family membrane-anchored ribosome-binding protein